MHIDDSNKLLNLISLKIQHQWLIFLASYDTIGLSEFRIAKIRRMCFPLCFSFFALISNCYIWYVYYFLWDEFFFSINKILNFSVCWKSFLKSEIYVLLLSLKDRHFPIFAFVWLLNLKKSWNKRQWHKFIHIKNSQLMNLIHKTWSTTSWLTQNILWNFELQ